MNNSPLSPDEHLLINTIRRSHLTPAEANAILTQVARIALKNKKSVPQVLHDLETFTPPRTALLRGMGIAIVGVFFLCGGSWILGVLLALAGH